MAPLDQLGEDAARILSLQQRPVVAPRDPREQHVEIGAQPHRDAALRDEVPGRRVHERAAAGCQHMHRLAEEPRDDAALAVAKDGFAAIAEDLFDRLTGRGLDLGIRIEERQIEPYGQAAPDLGLPRPHQADEDDRATGRESLCPCGCFSCLPGLEVHPRPFVPRRASARRLGRVLA